MTIFLKKYYICARGSTVDKKSKSKCLYNLVNHIKNSEHKIMFDFCFMNFIFNRRSTVVKKIEVNNLVNYIKNSRYKVKFEFFEVQFFYNS